MMSKNAQNGAQQIERLNDTLILQAIVDDLSGAACNYHPSLA